MALLVLDRAQLEVRSEGEALALYEAGERRGTVPIKLIERCVIHGAQTRLDSGVVSKLAQAGATIVFMSPRQQRRHAIVLGPQHNDAAIRIAQTGRVMNESACNLWALHLVQAKLARQARLLQLALKDRPDARKHLGDALKTLHTIIQHFEPKDESSSAEQLLPLSSLRGYEGSAARAYFEGLASIMPAGMGFAGRNRRPPRDPVNVCLSLAYTMLHMQAVQACVAIGLDPLIGFYHRPAYGRESLASDLIEPLRPVADEWVWNLLRSRTLRTEHFSTDKDACLLGKAGRTVFYAEWERTSQPIKRWLRMQTQHLARQLRTDGAVWLQADDEAEPC
jgi:CRISP-associated protein Cas1